MREVRKHLSGRFLVPVAVLAGVTAATGVVQAVPMYNFAPLATPTADGPNVDDAVSGSGGIVGISGSGEVVGTRAIDGQPGYTTSSGPLLPLGAVSSPPPSVYGVSTGGVAVGSATYSDGQYPVYFSGNQTYQIGNAPGDSGGSNTQATAVAETSTGFEVVGTFDHTTGPSSSVKRSFIWHGGTLPDASVTIIDPYATGLGGAGVASSSGATGVNSLGYVVGQATTAAGHTDGYLFSPTTSNFYDLPTSTTDGSDPQTLPNAINLGRTIVGQTTFGTAGSSPQAFVYTASTLPLATSTLPGNLQSLGTLAGDDTSDALAVNNNNVIVGYSTDSSSGAQEAFIDDGSQMYNLKDQVPALPSGWSLVSATGINDAGQITGVAQYTYPDDSTQYFGYVLNPITTSVPEPATLGLLGVTCALGLSRRRR